MASKQASKRLQKEYQLMMSNPPEFIIAKPQEANILIWHYIVTGPPDSPYHGGEYHGKVIFPEEYPYKPPAIKMLTPNGRFQIDTRLCLSMSDYHPGTWNPAWSVATILTGLLSFMLEETPTTGSIKTSVLERRSLAAKSKAWNRMDHRFREVWEDMLEEEERQAAAAAAGEAGAGDDILVKDRSDAVEEGGDVTGVAPAAIRTMQHDLRKRLPNGSRPVPQQPIQAAANGNVVLVQKAVDGVWGRVRSNLWLLLLGGVMTYLVVLKVVSKLSG
ncbi:ubiquitin-conjugating enzyme/RWD-like protein [Obelidium mucronatum]|nr:ubiquitin-conjugating enzyme/RWD-like protein [Obelidium mucronatum]